MFSNIDTSNPKIVEDAVRKLYLDIFPSGDPTIVHRAFEWTNDCFEGRYPGYQGIDLNYHNYEHTLQVILCMMEMLKARHAAGVEPVMDEAAFGLCIVAVLLHDSGYLKTDDDTEGTGAKYTLIHVGRSCDFVEVILPEKGFSPTQVESVQNMIRCTGVNVDLSTIPFRSDLAKVLGLAVGTADLVGQMSAHDYVEKLPFLYIEFKESFDHTSKYTNVAEIYADAEDLMENTPKFWEFYVKPKIENDFEKLYQFLNNPYPDGPNKYIDAILAHINGLKKKYGS